MTDFADIVTQHTALPECSSTPAAAAVNSESAGPSEQLALHGDGTLSLFVRCHDVATALAQRNLYLTSRRNFLVARSPAAQRLQQKEYVGLEVRKGETQV